MDLWMIYTHVYMPINIPMVYILMSSNSYFMIVNDILKVKEKLFLKFQPCFD